MHRTIEASIPKTCTPAVTKALLDNPHVIHLSVHPDSSLKPLGDTLVIHVLNRGTDDVLKMIGKETEGKEFSIATAEVASLTHDSKQKEINHDVDEAIWEEMETGLRHNGRTTTNYLILMFIGGVIASVGFISEMHDLVIAFVAASIIAPGMEPLAKIPLGIALKKWDVMWTGLKATFLGYFTLVAAALLTFAVLVNFGLAKEEDFTHNQATAGMLHLRLKDIILSLAAATASIIMYLSYRTNVIAGPLIALIIIPAAAAMGISLYLQNWEFLGNFSKRFLLDVTTIIIVGIICILLKQKFVHKREPLR
ncbi:hypothetical protein FIC_00912 [Flavobacteriaceae bacterium 3519-10]|nr:hypothetical protein FIC_00912 [Flavobacteriaceae bacterium 3519-10]